MCLVLLFSCLILICYHHATIADSEDKPKPTGLPVQCPPGYITVGERQRCLKYEEKPLCYEEAQKKCLDADGALAELSPSTENIDRVKAEVLKHHPVSSDAFVSTDSIWVVDSNPPIGMTKWDAHCLQFRNDTARTCYTPCKHRACRHMAYFCEYYKYNPCGGDDATKQRWVYRDEECLTAVYRPEGFTFSEAMAVCKELHVNSTVATVDSRGKNDLTKKLLEIEGQLNGNPPDLADAWIGLHLDLENQTATWQNGEEDDYYMREELKGQYPWAPGEPNNHVDGCPDCKETCVQVNTGKDKSYWNDRSCDVKLKAVPTRFPFQCPPGFITVGERQRCLKYEEKPVCYDEAQKKCLDADGALAEISPSTENIDRVKAEVLKHHPGSSDDASIWVVNKNPPSGLTKWDAHCLQFSNLTTQSCHIAACKHLPYFCEYYKYNPCGGDDAQKQGWVYRDEQCLKAVYRKLGFTFSDAIAVCKELNSIVATVDSRGKNELTKKLLEVEGQLNWEGAPILTDAWIGLHLDLENQTATWQNGEEDDYYLREENRGKYPWAPGEPNNRVDECADCKEMCVQVNTDQDKSYWNDRSCDVKLKAVICSRPYAFRPVGTAGPPLSNYFANATPKYMPQGEKRVSRRLRAKNESPIVAGPMSSFKE
ncbi:lectin c-type domain-containing protein [Ditylenchus destructor]|nr:lectin c-type domain-containing protein [Ditylenchus destructor]